MRRSWANGRCPAAISTWASWQLAAARELWEETGIRTAPEGLQLLGVHSGYGGRTLIVVGRSTPMRSTDLPPFAPLPEVSQRQLIRPPDLARVDMAFPLHRQVVAAHFAAWPAAD
ncbi:MAG: NUDIX domain-containing protein [Caldilineaceae bacterium]